MTDPCGCGPFRVRVLVPAPPAVVRVPAPAEPAVIRQETPGPMGPQGPKGQDGTGATLSFPITSAASFTAIHGLPYTPRAMVLTSSGEQIDTDTYYGPGQVTVMFAQPFTGTLYVG